MTVELVDDSWIDSVGGLSRWYILRTPPLFWADATPLPQARDAATTPANTTERIRVSFPVRAACRAAASLRRHSTLPLCRRQAQIAFASQTGGSQMKMST